MGIKNIIFIDSGLTYLASLMANSEVHICVLVCDYYIDEERKNLIEKYRSRIDKIYFRIPIDYDNFFEINKSDYNLTSDDIKAYENVQLKVARALSRQILDNPEIEYRYLNSLRFWLGVFQEYKIDKIISLSLQHGDCYDEIPYEIAMRKNIKIYIFEGQFGNHSKILSYIKCLNDNSFLNISKVLDDKPDVDEYVFSKKAMNIKKESFCKLFSRWCTWNIKMPLKVLWDKIKSSFLSEKTKFLKETSNYESFSGIPKERQLKIFRYIEKLRKVYNKISIIPDYNVNYIFYALHFEPEASILNRGQIRNQLFVIKLLSDNLPDGWKLYVKEHPYQFDINWRGAFYLFKYIEFYKSLLFYRQIKRLKNVELISMSQFSKKLVQNAKATATIAGTVALETISQNIPLIIFSSTTTITSLVNDVFSINSIQDLKNAINKIKDGFKPNYNNLNDLFKNYLYEDYVDKLATVILDNDEKINKLFNYILNL